MNQLLLLVAALAGAAVSAAVIWLGKNFFHRQPPQEPPFGNPTEWDRRFMAYHEAGHAVASQYLPERPPLLRITISPSDEAFGMIRTAPRPDHNETRTSLASTLAVMLAGRIAEERFLYEITTSCVHDLAAAKQLATDMVLELGMGGSAGMTLPPAELAAGDDVLRQRDADIQKLLADAVRTATEVLNSHADEVAELAERLLRDGTLDQKEIERFFRSRRLSGDRADAGDQPFLPSSRDISEPKTVSVTSSGADDAARCLPRAERDGALGSRNDT